MTRLIHYRYTRPGVDTRVFDQWLVHDEPDVKILLLEHHAGKSMVINGQMALETGAPVVWFVFPRVWHDIGRFHRADGTFTGWYTNLCTPVEQAGDEWSSTDLFLDHWLTPNGDGEWLDEHEFIGALQDGILDHRTRARVTQERERIDRRLAAGTWPPVIAREVDLDSARLKR